MEKHICPWWFAYTFDNPLRRLFHKPEKIFSPDEADLFRQVHAILKKSCKLLYAEPKMHVSQVEFSRTLSIAQEQGFSLIGSPPICCSYTAILEK